MSGTSGGVPNPVLRIRIHTDPHLKSHPESGSAWTDADPDPGGKKSLENVHVHEVNTELEEQK